ncbi:Ubiquitin carboxyl-terminal hydrolase 8 [Acorus calamus]|uniref:ubiquitinyl hydrolase 1 n=1 Tax=Acorus calamus TaxID=4465 RepID=A0AAV9CDU1_ACOCL|nr:Ubiquitin carboxyl-terminal hydrolase 8 [Acorus calamus]
MDGFTPEKLQNPSDAPTPEDERVYFVPYKWWRKVSDQAPDDSGGGDDRGILYAAGPSSSSYGGPMRIINNIFNSDLVFSLRREDSDPDAATETATVSGREYALVTVPMWSRGLRWHRDLSAAETATKEVGVSSDNAAEFYKRACKIFTVESEPVRMWDFSGQTSLIFMNEQNKFLKDGQRQSEQEILIELQVYAWSDPMICRSEGRKDDLPVRQSKFGVFSCYGSIMGNGSTGASETALLSGTPDLCKNYAGGSLGLVGLQNLGNTCFMNSAIQCLAHTSKIVDFFLGDYSREINRHNPLGMNGELALAFGDLLRKLWAPERNPVFPRLFKSKISHFNLHFNGYNQHDSQELLAFLLDGLHEDLNRVKNKPYIEAKDACGRPDDEVADEYWANHLARNDSIIVDLCQGQYRSTLVCPVCKKVSVTFDPFMYLSLPLPSTNMRTMTITVLSPDGNGAPRQYIITVVKNGKYKDFIQALSVACSLRSDEDLIVAEVYNNRIIRYVEEPADALSLIRDGDRLVAYRLPKDPDGKPLVVFTHQHLEEIYILGDRTLRWKAFGIPFVTRLPSTVGGCSIQKSYLSLLNPILRTKDSLSEDDGKVGKNCNDDEIMESAIPPISDNGMPSSGTGEAVQCGFEFKFYLTDEKGEKMHSEIKMNEPISVTGLEKRLYVLVSWPDELNEQFDMRLMNYLPEIFKPGFFLKRPQETVSLYQCLEEFLKEEPLGPEDKWSVFSRSFHLRIYFAQ